MIPSALTAGCLRSTCAAAVATVAALTLASSAAAEEDHQIFLNNCNADNQSGDACVYTAVVKNNPEGIYVQFISSPDMCSNITARIGVGEPQPHYIGEDLVAPGAAGTKYYIAGPGNTVGYTTVFVHPTGHAGGCNTGGLAEWAGTLHVENRGYSLPGQ
jgi:hypothetical protein